MFLVNLPLINTLGYEFSALNSLLLVIISGLFSISYLIQNPTNYKRLIKKLLLFFLLPLVISLVHSLFTMFCSVVDGLLFYFIIVLPSVFVGLGLSIISILLIKKFRKTFFIFLILFLALIPVLEIYFFPQVYFYSPLIGYFPGNIYDEGLSPDWKLILHQLIILIYFLSIIIFYFQWNNKLLSIKVKFISIIVFTFATFEFISSSLGFITPFSRLESYLPEKIVTENTVLHYDKLNKTEAEYVALNQQYYFEKLSNELKLKLNKKVDVYLFNSRDQKKELFGAGNADVAKPWQYSVYVSIDSWNYTLQHEMVHVFSAEFGTGIFKLASGFNASMIEGIAEAIDNDVDNYLVKDVAALAFGNNYKIDINNLFEGLNFFKQNSTLSYTYSGAFFRFLIENYGIEKVKKFYSDGSFRDNFKKDITVLRNEFDDWLKSSNKIGNKNMADYYFGRLSLVQKICPRFISDRLRKAWDYFYANNFEEAKSLFDEINNKVTNYSALIGLSEIYFKGNKINSAINLLNHNLDKLTNTPFYFLLQLKIADFYSQVNKTDSAKIIYDNLREENANYYLTALAKLRSKLLDNGLLTNYLAANDSIKFNILSELNEQSYYYDSIDLILQLARENKIEYSFLQKIFDKTFIIDNIESSYAVFKLSQYLLEIGKYNNSRKMAALSLRYKTGNPFYNTFKQNYDKVSWFFSNADEKISTFKYEDESVKQN